MVAVFSVQEEVGLRGAIVAAYGVEPTLGMKIRKVFPGRGKYSGTFEGEIVELASRKGGRHRVRFPNGLWAMTSGEIAECEVVG